MDVQTKAEIIKRFLGGTSLERLTRGLDATKEDAFNLLCDNPTTAEILRKKAQRNDAGEFDSFFYKAQYGRPKLPEQEKRKVRQVRISGAELEQLGNPTSTQMRSLMLDAANIKATCEKLDKMGVLLVTDEMLASEYDMNDAFWKSVLSTNYSRLKALSKLNEN